MREFLLPLRRDILAAALAIPALLGAAGVSLIESGRSAGAQLTSRSFAEALRAYDVDEAYAFIRNGADPNAPVAFQHDELTGGREIMVAPLLVAVAAHRENVVLMLIGFGARADRPGTRYAQCLANYLGDEEIADVIREYGGGSPAPVCPSATVSPDAPLLAFAE